MFNITIKTTAAISTAKQVTINNSSAANSIMYTVPLNRKFIGYIGNTQSGPQTFINGTPVYCHHGSGTTVAQSGALVQHTLLAGTIVKEGGSANTSFIYGVEYDA